MWTAKFYILFSIENSIEQPGGHFVVKYIENFTAALYGVHFVPKTSKIIWIYGLNDL